MDRLRLNSRNSPSRKLFVVLLVFIVIAILLTFEKVAKLAIQGVQQVAPDFSAPVEVFQQTAANLAWLGVGVLVLMLLPVVAATPVIWASMAIIGAAIVYTGLKGLYGTFFGGKTEIDGKIIKK